MHPCAPPSEAAALGALPTLGTGSEYAEKRLHAVVLAGLAPFRQGA